MGRYSFRNTLRSWCITLPLIFFSSSSAFEILAQPDEINRFDLEQCIGLGLTNNPEYQSSGFLVEKSNAKIDEAFAGYYPFVNLNSDADAFSKNGGEQRYNNISTGLTMTYNIFQGFKTKSAYEASKSSYEADLYRHETNKRILIFNITRAYYLVLQSERILRSTEEAVKNSLLHLDFARAKQKAGMATRTDILKSEVEVSNAELDRIKASNNLLAAKGSLNQLLGLPSDRRIDLEDDLSDLIEINIQSFDSLFASAINSRTEIKRYQYLLDAQQNTIRIAKSDLYPSLGTTANYSYAGPEFSSVRHNWWLGLSLSIPVFKGFSTKARVNQEEYAYKGLEKEYEVIKQQISQEVWNALLAVKESVERISASSKALESAREHLLLAEGEYREGVGSIIQLTDAQTTFVAAEQNYIYALSDYKISHAELERTIGN